MGPDLEGGGGVVKRSLMPPLSFREADESRWDDFERLFSGRGGPKAYRLRIRAPSFFMFQPVDEMIRGENIADVIAVIGSVNIIAGELDR